VTLADFNAHPVTIVVSEGRYPLPEYLFPLVDVYSSSRGMVIISGRDLFNRDLVIDSLVVLDSTSIGFQAGIRATFYPRILLANPTRMNAEFKRAAQYDRSLPTLEVDSARTDWGLNPALPRTGSAIPFVGYLEIDSSRAEILYTYVSRDQNSPANGRPVAVMDKSVSRALAVFAFPLSYVYESEAVNCIDVILGRMGYGTLDSGTPDALIDYLYRGGEQPRHGDVNRVGVVDIIDVVRKIVTSSRAPSSTGRLLP
jgi:hypothetical protein